MQTVIVNAPTAADTFGGEGERTGDIEEARVLLLCWVSSLCRNHKLQQREGGRKRKRDRKKERGNKREYVRSGRSRHARANLRAAPCLLRIETALVCTCIYTRTQIRTNKSR
jgi:hypothetical protein